MGAMREILFRRSLSSSDGKRVRERGAILLRAFAQKMPLGFEKTTLVNPEAKPALI